MMLRWRLRRIARRWAKYWDDVDHDPLVIFWRGIVTDQRRRHDKRR